MERSFNIIVVDDNEYYNDLIYQILKQNLQSAIKKRELNYLIYSYTDPVECAAKIKSGIFSGSENILYVDYYLGGGITGLHIIKLLKEYSYNVRTILLSNSSELSKRINNLLTDHYIIKDMSAASLCNQYLDQFLADRIFVNLIRE